MIFGISRFHLLTLDFDNLIRQAANTIGSQGIFGYGKNQTLANYGKKNNANWASLQALSLAIVAVTMLKNNHSAVNQLKESLRFSDIKDHVF